MNAVPLPYGQAGTQSQASLRLPLFFIFSGIVLFFIFHVLSLFSLGSWIDDDPRQWAILSNVHLLVLGWGTMIAMGAVYQLIQVVLQSQIYSERLGYFQYAVFTIGTVGLVFGFRISSAGWIAVFAVLAFVGIALFAYNLLMTLLKAAKWNSVTLSTAFAVLYLLLAGTAGMVMGLNFHFGKLGDFHQHLFGAHIWFGVAGWFGLLITGYSYKLLPMFVLAHDFPTELQKYVLFFWNLGVIGGSLAFLAGLPDLIKWLGALSIAIAAVLYAIHVSQIYRHRFKKNAGPGVLFTILLNKCFAVFSVLAVICLLLGWNTEWQTKMIMIISWGYLWGWVAMTILGYLSKIAPFLWWTYKYGPKAGKEKVPQLSEMLNERHVKSGLFAIGISLLAVLVGIGVGEGVLVAIAGTALSLFSLWYMGLIALVFTK